MNINKSIDLSKTKSVGAANTAEAKNVPVAPEERDGDKENSIGQDNISLSAEALKLSSTSVSPAVNNQTQMPDQDKVKELLAKTVEAIRNNPGQAKAALSSISSSNVGRLLAETITA
ncbi:MAG: hypothetical protein PHH11_00910 [Methylomonas sp.]|nr:hypothetical protein [Methylomonas sp.]